MRLLLIMTIILKLKTLQVDFSNVFAPADIPPDNPVYIEVPTDFEANLGENAVLKLKKFLYGQAEAPRLWYYKLRKGLEDRGFVASTVDQCLFMSPTVICIAYMD